MKKYLIFAALMCTACSSGQINNELKILADVMRIPTVITSSLSQDPIVLPEYSVRMFQRSLVSRGVEPDFPNGVWSEKWQKALAEIERENNLIPDGKIDKRGYYQFRRGDMSNSTLEALTNPQASWYGKGFEPTGIALGSLQNEKGVSRDRFLKQYEKYRSQSVFVDGFIDEISINKNNVTLLKIIQLQDGHEKQYCANDYTFAGQRLCDPVEALVTTAYECQVEDWLNIERQFGSDLLVRASQHADSHVSWDRVVIEGKLTDVETRFDQILDTYSQNLYHFGALGGWTRNNAAYSVMIIEDCSIVKRITKPKS